jgi:hypothetical protein
MSATSEPIPVQPERRIGALEARNDAGYRAGLLRQARQTRRAQRWRALMKIVRDELRDGGDVVVLLERLAAKARAIRAAVRQ